ncbi:MAG: VOC family protein [Stigonema ocellatum SAG 48.90 = DSM 106950]|nr:VOC family protein [Stigonema ocellatum SAG 48.90 = DSM 106950]
MMKLKFVSTKLYVYNYEACLHFYRDILGFDVNFVAEHNGCAELNTGETKLSLLKLQNLKEVFASANLVSSAKSSDVIALSFKVNNLHEVCKQLKAQGVTFINHEPWYFPDWGFSSILCRDPDGNMIELQQLLS